jgi:predicted enzyme related to lactoylglutathione lyase/catechol 2,3-dioxygenase-like lactoylglutathione lyase family enzyme
MKKNLLGKYGWRVAWLPVLMTLIMAGCGSKEDSTVPALKSGVFIDSSVAGLSYSTTTQSGLTNAEGTFQYREGETVTFSAGEIVLGSTVGKAVVTPIDLVAGIRSAANSKVVNISRFLQLIDVNGNHTDGIEITPGIRALLTWNPANGTNDGSIFQDEVSVFLSTGNFAANFMNPLLTTLNGAGVFTAVTPRALTSRSATGARRNLYTTLNTMSPQLFSPVVREVGIGVTSLSVSMPFYQNVMGLNFADYQGRADRVEASYEDNRASNKHKVVLMEFNNPAINCTDRPVKLVFAVPNCAAAYTAITTGGGSEFSACAFQPGLGQTVGMAKDPDGYLIELIQVPALSAPYLTAIGIGVASLQPIDDFYTRVIGMRFNYYLYVMSFMNEVIMQSPQSPWPPTTSIGMDIVLMDYFNDTGKDYNDVPAKIVYTVASPMAVSQAIAAEGLPIIQTPSAGVRGVAKDPLGYEVELAAAP